MPRVEWRSFAWSSCSLAWPAAKGDGRLHHLAAHLLLAVGGVHPVAVRCGARRSRRSPCTSAIRPLGLPGWAGVAALDGHLHGGQGDSVLALALRRCTGRGQRNRSGSAPDRGLVPSRVDPGGEDSPGGLTAALSLVSLRSADMASGLAIGGAAFGLVTAAEGLRKILLHARREIAFRGQSELEAWASESAVQGARKVSSHLARLREKGVIDAQGNLLVPLPADMRPGSGTDVLK